MRTAASIKTAPQFDIFPMFLLSTGQEPRIIHHMKSLSVGEFKAKLSDLLEEVQQGETIEVLYGKKRKPVARLVPIKGEKRKKKVGAWSLGGQGESRICTQLQDDGRRAA